MLSEDQLRRIAELRTDAPARRAIDALLEERRRLVAVVQRLARQLHQLRERMKQAAGYLDRLAGKAYDITHEPWPRQIPCPRCGAPITRSRVEQGPGGNGHVEVWDHPDGTRCS